MNSVADQIKRLVTAARTLYLTCKWVPENNPAYLGITPERQRELWQELRDAAEIKPGTATAAGVGADVPPVRPKAREQVYAVIDMERNYQDAQYPENEAHPKLSPSDELRLLQTMLNQAHQQWYSTHDRVIDGVKVNPSDLHMLRKMAACCVRCLEHFGAPDRPEWTTVANPPPKV